jgi:uncharacterized protein YlxP (DUF503 family)
MLPKKFQKMNQQEKEVYLISKLKVLHEEETLLRRILAKVRGNHIVETSEIDRVDLFDLKGETN